MRTRLAVANLMTAIILAAGTVRADYGYVFDHANYSVALGATVDVLVYLQETGTSIFRDKGLIGAGVQVRFDDPPQPISPAEVLYVTDVSNVSDFEVEWSKSAVPNLAYADLALGTFGYVYGTEAGSDVYRVLLGKFTFTAGTVLGEMTHIRATDFSTSTADTIYYDDESNPVALDGAIYDGTATITTVPEPSAILLLVIAGLSLPGYFWRKRSK